jgi:hypothetical protein
MSTQYLIREYPLQQGALEIAYIEEFFSEFPTRKTAAEIMRRLQGREFQILMAEASLPEDASAIVPVGYKVSHELRAEETDPKLADSSPARRPGDLRRPGLTTGSARHGSTGASVTARRRRVSVVVAEGYDEVIVRRKPLLRHAGLLDACSSTTACRRIRSSRRPSKRPGRCSRAHRSRRRQERKSS